MKYFFFILLISCYTVNAQVVQKKLDKGSLMPGTEYTDAALTKHDTHRYTVQVDRGGQYEFYVMQKGIDIMVKFYNPAGKAIVEKDSPNGTAGPENFDLNATDKGTYILEIIPFSDAGAVDSGKYSVFLKKLTREQVKRKTAIKLELAEENKKNVLTLDIDHFWDAFDHLEKCKTFKDSVRSFQERYIDKATDGFLDFLSLRRFTAEEYTRIVARFPKFYNSIRANTYEVKKAVPLIEEVFAGFKKLYPGFKPFKVCFAIGTIRTGGTTSKDFVLIGTEITTSTKNNDLTELINTAMGKVLAGDSDVVQKIKNIIAHECVHTQQLFAPDSTAEKCDLLYASLMEGSCDFIGELVAGNQINKVAQEYGNAHEATLWKEFSSELCNKSIDNWLYNYSLVKDRPADLGYYIGYKICQAYYNRQADKQQAITDMLEMKDPKKFLELSGYGKNFSGIENSGGN